MMIPDAIFEADCARLLADWGAGIVAQVVAADTSFTSTSVTAIIAKQRIAGIGGAPDTFEMTITTATDSLPTVPGGSTLRWQYEGFLWEVRERRNQADGTVTIFIVRRVDE